MNAEIKPNPGQSAAPRCDVVNVIRALAMDAVQKANSGHPGMPMGMAEIAEVLWRRHLRHNPANPRWADRDRFVVSNGHGSMLLYALLHLTGYDLPMEQLQRFRQMGSKTPGHPEYGITPGAETTTGPLGQGISNAVGMAIAEKLLAEEFNRTGIELFSHWTYAFVGDGCLMEGISHEACSLAGTLGLGKLIVFYDDNGISIDGHVKGWFTDDTPKRFEAYGWHVIPDVDGHDSEAVDRAIVASKAVQDRPSLICCKTVIGKGAPTKAGSHDSHGAPLGGEEIAGARAQLGWTYPPFVVPSEVYEAWDAREAGALAESNWNRLLGQYSRAYPSAARELQRRLAGDLPPDFAARVQALTDEVREKAASIASRKASQDVIEALAPGLPELLGGSADLAGSNLTLWSGSRAVANRGGNYIHYGVREFGMAAIMNGITLHGGFIPYGGTFLTFSDYCRNALRMAALMRIRSIFVFTHDSIGLGEDGPTHQAVEHVASLRLIPNMDVWRPCDTEESVVAWAAALGRRDGPACLIFSRQNLPFQKRSPVVAANISRGGYVLVEPDDAAPRAIIISTGSEIGLAVEAQRVLGQAGIAVRVVSMVATSVFDRQPQPYRDSVLPPGLPCVAVEAGSPDLWRKYVGRSGEVIGMTTFGESAPAGELFRHFGFTAGHVAEAVKSVLERAG